MLHTGKAETTSLDKTGDDDIVLSEQEATKDNNKQGITSGNPQEEDLGDIEAIGKMSVGGGASMTNKTCWMDLSFRKKTNAMLHPSMH